LRVVWIALALCAAIGQGKAGELDAFTRNASCLIEANSIVKLSSPTQGTLSKVLVARGDRVREGQVIAQLDSDAEEAALAAAEAKAGSGVLIEAREAEYSAARNKLDRARQLINKAIMSQAQFDEAQMQSEVARLAVEQAKFEKTMSEIEARRLRVMVDRRNIRSPINGVITKVDMHPGEFADPQQAPIAVISEIVPLLVQVYLQVGAFPLIKVGAAVEVRPAAPIGGAYDAEVITRDPQIDAASGLFQITLRLPNANGAIPAGVRCAVSFK
jgi:RND family efflux transporter MFP subunit